MYTIYIYGNILSQTQCGLTKIILSLETRSQKRRGGKVLVKMSVVRLEVTRRDIKCMHPDDDIEDDNQSQYVSCVIHERYHYAQFE